MLTHSDATYSIMTCCCMHADVSLARGKRVMSERPVAMHTKEEVMAVVPCKQGLQVQYIMMQTTSDKIKQNTDACRPEPV